MVIADGHLPSLPAILHAPSVAAMMPKSRATPWTHGITLHGNEHVPDKRRFSFGTDRVSAVTPLDHDAAAVRDMG
ncbi:MAG: hypothetical protein ACKPEA_09905, partial [Planctomycetota bacterium]